jgi:hypothetical protein
MNALISGSTGRVLLLDGESLMSFDVEDPSTLVKRQKGDLSLLFGDARDLRIIENSDVESIAAELQRACNSGLALDLVLIVIDPELSDEIRREAITDVEGLFSDQSVLEYVERILYGRPLPKKADIEGALVCCSKTKTPNARAFLQRVKSHQPSISEVSQAWEAIPTEVFGGAENRAEFLSQAVREGLFRSLALTREARASISILIKDHPIPHIQRLPNPAAVNSLLNNAGANLRIQTLPNYGEVLARWFAPFRLQISTFKRRNEGPQSVRIPRWRRKPQRDKPRSDPAKS